MNLCDFVGWVKRSAPIKVMVEKMRRDGCAALHPSYMVSLFDEGAGVAGFYADNLVIMRTAKGINP